MDYINEMQKILEKEAKKRGFEYGVDFIALEDKQSESKNGTVGSFFRFENGKLYSCGYGRFCVYKNETWAEVVKDTPEYTMEELTDKLGHTFKIKK